MRSEAIFRLLFAIAALAMTIIRVYYQSKVMRDEVEIREGSAYGAITSSESS